MVTTVVVVRLVGQMAAQVMRTSTESTVQAETYPAENAMTVQNVMAALPLEMAQALCQWQHGEAE